MAEHSTVTLEANHLSKSYKGRQVVRDISLKVAAGEVVGLLGPNGAGKTTTFYMIVGLIKPDSGNIVLNGRDLTDSPMYQRARKGVSYLPQEASIFRRMTVEENLLATLELLDLSSQERLERMEQLLVDFNVEHIRRGMGFSLSGGERRRVEIARALTNQPSFILLDEPFAGIDPKAVGDIQLIIEKLQSRNIGVLITDHNVRETLKITQRAYILSDGVILKEGSPEMLARDELVRKTYLGDQFKLD
ncbi:LPS export ABC transporter ATP-binding protein [Sulfidibacter corallicola]|uniref:LPS export ABC transporter ATP-binding protein n=1 Tax=Sulfidibacter corallicola TaxID=2818388 RepID=A0A8A4TUJ7_SULCO|nr:LPS export ABC transporter ATP-binding protein [Sulfidibacter corallicola]QTD52702.1 LPS export ABC transporter ATP-binding protein [Sulfidibacter corallicola]